MLAKPNRAGEFCNILSIDVLFLRVAGSRSLKREFFLCKLFYTQALFVVTYSGIFATAVCGGDHS